MNATSPVLVLNSGSSSVKFALLDPESGERVLSGLAEEVGTPEAALRIRRDGNATATERLPGADHQAVISRILAHLADAGMPHPVGAGHRVATGASGSPPQSWWTTR